jgi:polysaccharide export outer membrane protein
MLKRRSKSLKASIAAGCLVGTTLIFTTPKAARAQETSPVITAPIDESATPSTARQHTFNPPTLTAAPEGLEHLKLAPGYLLQMDIYNVAEMSTELRVDDQGEVTIPLVGRVHIADETLEQAQTTIAKALVDKQILKDPQVTLNIIQFAAKYISVLGEVHAPGHIQLLAPAPLGDILAMVDGETIAAGNDIEIQHRQEDGKVTTRNVRYAQGEDPSVLQSVFVDPGDTVMVHRAGIIYVLGAVFKPGGYLMVNRGSLSVIQAVSMAGGTTLQASTKWAIVVRRQGNGFVQFRVPLGKMETGKATPVQLQLNDALYVPVSSWKAVVINGSNVISAATSAAVYRFP